jgi:hypothetical protein
MVPDNELTQRIIGCAIDVHRVLGPGLRESSYDEALALEFGAQRIAFDRQPVIGVAYRGRSVGVYRIDFVIEAAVVEVEGGCTVRSRVRGADPRVPHSQRPASRAAPQLQQRTACRWGEAVHSIDERREGPQRTADFSKPYGRQRTGSSVFSVALWPPPKQRSSVLSVALWPRPKRILCALCVSVAVSSEFSLVSAS